MSESRQNQKKAPRRDVYFCPECGCQMMIEDNDMLICPECGVSMSIDEFEAQSE